MKKILFLFCLILATSCGEKTNSNSNPKDDSSIVEINKVKTSIEEPNVKKTSNKKPSKDLLNIAGAFDLYSELKHETPAKKNNYCF